MICMFFSIFNGKISIKRFPCLQKIVQDARHEYYEEDSRLLPGDREELQVL